MTTARHSPSFTAPAEKKGWIVSKANKTGQFSIITTTPDARAFHNYLPPLARGTPSFIKKENIQVRPPRRFAPPLQVSPTKHKCVSWGPMGGELTHRSSSRRRPGSSFAFRKTCVILLYYTG